MGVLGGGWRRPGKDLEREMGSRQCGGLARRCEGEDERRIPDQVLIYCRRGGRGGLEVRGVPKEGGGGRVTLDRVIIYHVLP